MRTTSLGRTSPTATNDEDKGRFLKEAAIMAQFNHPNIVSLVGVCTQPENEPTLIVLEYMHLGALQSYLQRCVLLRYRSLQFKYSVQLTHPHAC